MATEVTDMRDIILATLAEIEEDIEYEKEDIELSVVKDAPKASKEKEQKPVLLENTSVKNETKEETDDKNLSEILHKLDENIDDEDKFLSGMSERLLVLFEGLRASNNQRLEKKLNLTVSYLEYTLAIIDERLENKNS